MLKSLLFKDNYLVVVNTNRILDKSPNHKILMNGQTIPIIVGDKVKYNTNSNTVNVLGTVLMPVMNNSTYYIEGKVDYKLYNTISFLIEKIKSQESKLKDTKVKEMTRVTKC